MVLPTSRLRIGVLAVSLAGLGFVAGRFSVQTELLPVAMSSLPVPAAINEPMRPWLPTVTAEVSDTADWLARLGANARRVPSALADAEREQLLQQLAARDPALALQQLGAVSGERGQRQLMLVLLQWAQRDVQAAWQWLASHQPENLALRLQLLTNSAVQGAAVIALAQRWVSDDPNHQSEIHTALLNGWLQNGQYTQARDWVMSHINGSGRADSADASLLLQVAEQWARYQPEQAAQWVQGLPETPRRTALAAVVNAWSESDPAQSVMFVAGLADADRAALWQTSLGAWLATDRAGAEAWLAGANHLRDYDQALYRYVTTIDVVADHPDAALSWTERIRDDALRSDALRQVLTTIHARDPNQADAYVRTATSLTDDERSALLTMLAST